MTERRWLRRLAGLAAAGVFLLVIANAASFAATLNPWFDLATHFRAHYAVCALIALPALAFARYWRWSAAAAAVLALNTALLWPYVAPAADGRALAAPVPGDVPAIRVLHANVLTRNTNHAALAELIRDTEPNIVVLQEVDTAWLRALADVTRRFPHRLELPRADNFGIAAYSLWPGSTLQPVELVPGGTPAIALQIPTRRGRVHVLTLHPVPPVGTRLSTARNRHLEAAGELMRQWPDKKLLVGDLNITPWSPHFSTLLDTAGLRDPRRWQGLAVSWPAYAPALGIPIDHALPGDALALIVLERRWFEGSDHAALFSAWTLLP